MSRLPLAACALFVFAGLVPAQAPSPKRTKPSFGLGGCSITAMAHTMSFVPGVATPNSFVTTADPETRRFLVYVPSSYATRTAPLPLVYMLHGTAQTAQAIMHNTTWNHAAEFFGFIVVYPEALEYLMQDGTVVTKWATDNVEDAVVDPSELPLADDVLFLRELHNTLITHLDVDCRRVYASGFSNGGSFVKTEIRVQLADLFAATSNAGGIGIPNDSAAHNFPANGVDFRPHYEIIGTKDEKKRENCRSELLAGEDLPRHVVDVMGKTCMWDPLLVMAEATGQDPNQFHSLEDPDFTEIVWDTTLLAGPGPTEYRFRILPGLIHEFPSGTNHPIDYVPILWTWMSQYTR